MACYGAPRGMDVPLKLNKLAFKPCGATSQQGMEREATGEESEDGSGRRREEGNGEKGDKGKETRKPSYR